jgi:HK97 gp10 family phage protein
MAVKSTVTIYQNGDVIKGAEEGAKLSNFQMGLQTIAQAKALCPVDNGQLRNTLMFTDNVAQEQFNDSKGTKAPDSFKIPQPSSTKEMFYGSNANYAVYPEFGTVKMIAQPYLRPATELLKQDAEKVAAKYSREEMAKELKVRKAVKQLRFFGGR